MSVQNSTDKVIYNGDGSSTVFSFNYNLYLATDLLVYTQVVSSGALTLLTLNTNYSITLTPVSGTTGAYTASVNLAGGGSPIGVLPVGTNLILLRSIPYTQLINISDYSATPAATWEQGFDRATILAIQLLEQINRAIIQNVGATSQIVFPAPLANFAIGWDPTGTFLLNLASPGSVPIPIPNSYLAALTTAGLVSGAALTLLPNIPAGAGLIPIANLPVGTTANKIVQLNGSAQLPALDASLLLNTFVKVATANPSAAASFTISSLVAGKRYRLELNLIQNTSAGYITLIFNGDSGSQYLYAQSFAVPGTGASAAGVTSATTFIALSLAPTATIDAGTPLKAVIEFESTISGAIKVHLVGLVSQITSSINQGGSISGTYDGSTLTSLTIATSAGTMTGVATLYQEG